LRQADQHIRVIISGGGTGGHIFPAISIANAIREARPDSDILFVGAEGRMEMEKVPAAGYRITGLPIAGIKREWSLDNLSFPVKLVRSLRKAANVIREFRPDVAVGVGGYASGPLLFVASLRGIPTLVQEQNSYPGITNRILSRRAAAVCVAYEGMERYFEKAKIVFTGNPVRNDIINLEGKRSEGGAYFNIDPGRKTLLVVGGSQGARSINRSICDGLQAFISAGLQVVWQTGKTFYPEAKAAAERLNSDGIRVYDFITRMDYAYACADVVVGRAGASTVSELCIVRKPSILVPLPTAAEDHQTRNCSALLSRNAALMVRDSEAATKLVAEAIRLMGDEPLRKQLSTNIAPLARPDAAKRIASQIFELINRNQRR